MRSQRFTPRSAPGATEMAGSRFVLAGVERTVWLSRRGEGYLAHVDDGVPVTAALGDCAYTLVVDGCAEPVHVAVEGEAVFIHLEGRAYHLRYLDPVLSPAGMAGGGQGGMEARAPMPGTVVSLPVGAGDEVQAGDALVVIESMKLETTIRAAGPGRIAAVHVAEGQSFDRDKVLVTLAEAG